jgi:hypothetical protein
MFFVLDDIIETNHKINSKPVYKVNKCVRGLHAIGISKKGEKI